MKKQPGKFRLADAIRSPKAPAAKTEGRSGDAREPQEAQVQHANAEVNAGIKSNKERLVEIGRGKLAAGRQQSSRRTGG
jgi:hypothetical protein